MLTVNDPGDALDQEAERVATEITGGFSDPGRPMSKPEPEPQPPTASDLSAGGEPLAAGVTEFFEPRLGYDLSAVRIHSGEVAARYSEALDAYAFTYGSHIWLGQGARPRQSHLLAHELAHVVQQTQPPPTTAQPAHQSMSQSQPGVQRYAPYWMPTKFRRVGTETHALILPVIGEKNGIFTEAPVPNADKNGPDFDKKGIADLYQASTTVGVFFAGYRQPRDLASNRRLQYKGARYSHKQLSAPRANETRRSVVRGGSAPTKIFVGDLKPSHGTIEADEGPEQVQKYLEGFRFVREQVNEMPIGTGGFQQTDTTWPELTTDIIDIEVPAEFKEPIAAGQQAQPLKLIDNGKTVDLPRAVKGKVYVRPSARGIWNYVWAPTTRLTLDELPTRVTRLGAEIASTIIRPLRSSPIHAAKMARPRPVLTPSPTRVLRNSRGAKKEVADPFDKVAFDRWQGDHARLIGEENRLEPTRDFKEATFAALAVQERQAAITSGFDLPPVTAREAGTVKTMDQIRFWTNPLSKVFGRLRFAFGGAFVKLVNAYYSIRERFHRMVDSKASPKSSGLTGTIIRIAFEVLKIASRILVGRTAQHLVDSLKTGVEKKLSSLVPEDKVEAFEAKIREVSEIADQLEQQAAETVEGIVERTIGPYEKHIELIGNVANGLSTVNSIIQKVRWGARVLACLSPPGWGCLWILAQSVIEKFASWLIDRCWFKKEIAPLVTGVSFIAELPRDLAKIIVEHVREFLPAQLRDVFADVDPSNISTEIDPNEICDKNDRYPQNRHLLEQRALAELKQEIGEEKWLAWTRLAELYGVRRGEPLSTEKIATLKKELKQASLAALQEAAEMPLFTPSKDASVTNLTNFLDEVERIKQERYGVGGSRGPSGGAGETEEIRLPGSEKDLGGDYRLTFRFQVVGGVGAGDYRGHVIKVDLADTIKGVLVTLDDVEVAVSKRIFHPNERRPERLTVELTATRNQFFEIERKYGTAVVDKIGVKRIRVPKGSTFRYTMPLGDRR